MNRAPSLVIHESTFAERTAVAGLVPAAASEENKTMPGPGDRVTEKDGAQCGGSSSRRRRGQRSRDPPAIVDVRPSFATWRGGVNGTVQKGAPRGTRRDENQATTSNERLFGRRSVTGG